MLDSVTVTGINGRSRIDHDDDAKWVGGVVVLTGG